MCLSQRLFSSRRQYSSQRQRSVRQPYRRLRSRSSLSRVSRRSLHPTRIFLSGPKLALWCRLLQRVQHQSWAWDKRLRESII